MVADGERRSRGRSSPTGSLGISESTHGGAAGPAHPVDGEAHRCADAASCERTFTVPISHSHAKRVMLGLDRAERPGATRAVRLGRSSPPTRAMMPTMDPEPIPTEPTTDPEPPDATSRRDRPLPGLGVTGGRPWTRVEGPSCGHRARARADVQRRDRGRTSRVACVGRRRDDDPGPHCRIHRLRRSSARPGTRSTPSTSAPTDLDDRELVYGAIKGLTEAVGDTGHTSFLTPEERVQRVQRPVRQVRRDRRPHRRRRGRSAAHRRRLQGQPGRRGRPDAPATRWSAVDGKATTGHEDRRDRRLGPRRGRARPSS